MQSRPVLVGKDGVTIRPARRDDLVALAAIRAEESVRAWWGPSETAEQVETDLFADDAESVLLVVDVDGEVAGGIQYSEEDDPMYRYAGIDVFVGSRYQNHGVGTTAVALLARFLFEQRDHHRVTIDPAATNTRAIRSYTKVGFRPIGVMRRYERLPDGEFRDGLLMDLLPEELTIPAGPSATS